VKTQTWISQ